MAKKGTQAAKEQRVAQVYKQLIRFRRRQEIIQYGMKRWGLSEPAIDKYIAEATARIKANASKDRQNIFEMAAEQLKEMFLEEREKGNNQLARNLLKDLRDLHGTDAPQKLQLEVNDLEEEEAALEGATVDDLENIVSAAEQILQRSNGHTTNGNGSAA